MQPIFDLKGDNSQRADVSGRLGKLAYKNQFVWIARISNVFQVFQGFLFLWGIKIIRFPRLLLIFCTDNTLEHTSILKDRFLCCLFYSCLVHLVYLKFNCHSFHQDIAEIQLLNWYNFYTFIQHLCIWGCILWNQNTFSYVMFSLSHRNACSIFWLLWETNAN